MGNSCSGICRKKAEEVKAKRGAVTPAEAHSAEAHSPAAAVAPPTVKLTTEQLLARAGVQTGRQVPGVPTPTHRNRGTLERAPHHPHRSDAVLSRPSAEIAAATQRRSHDPHPERFLSGTDLVERRAKEPSPAPGNPSTPDAGHTATQRF